MNELRFALAFAAAALVASPARAGAPIAPSASHPHVDVESAWIIWDPDSKRQDLILSAQFSQARSAFAYVLPLPSHPEVGAVDTDLRLALPRLIRAYQRRAPDWVMPSRDNRGPLGSVAFGDTGKVEAVVERADKQGVLPLARPWPAVDTWLERYARQGWELAMLQVPGTSLPNVRLTFQADRPYYPYREPPWSPDDHQPAGGRVLRLTVIAPEQVAWKTGVSVPTMSQAWLSFEVAHADLQAAFGELYGSLFEPEKRYWLTSFEDWHEVRVGDDDVTFARHAPMPAQGAPGTLEDKTRKGLKLEPIEPVAAAPSAARPSRQAEPKGWAPQRGRRGRKLIAGAALVLLVVGAWMFVHNESRDHKQSRER